MTIEDCDNGHDMKQISYTAPTCKTTGTKVFVCTRCGYSETETLLTIACNYQVKSITPSTCTEKGSRLLECTMCHTQKTEELDYLNHKYGAAVDTATCFLEGKLKYVCSACGHEETTATTPMLTHDFGADGYCSKCGIYKTLFDIDKLNTTYTFSRSSFALDIDGTLTAKFNKEASIPYTYFLSHKVHITTYLYGEDGALLDYITTNSTITTWEGQKALTVQYGGYAYNMANQFRLRFHPYYADIKVFSEETLQSTTSFKIEILCDGYEKIEKTYQIENEL